MSKNKERWEIVGKGIMNYKYYILICIILSGIVGGGFFSYVSSVVSVLLLAGMFYRILKEKKLLVICDMNLLAFSLISVSYFIVGLWAVDKGMAWMGGIKFLPVILFFLLMCQIEEGQREELITWLPVFGSMMTLLSLVMMQFSALRKIVTVSGRLGGFFQYPNTYALFMLVCFLVAVCRIQNIRNDRMNLVHVMIALAGIYLSGSRTVFVLLIFSIFLLILLKKEYRKYLFICMGGMAVIFLILFMFLRADMAVRLTNLSQNLSTFWGRLLYAQDALPMIMRYPFGMGYYGYYFIQQEMQTGVYSVVNAHNEFLQMILDVGFIPAFCFYGLIIKSVWGFWKKERVKCRNGLVLLVMLLHSLFDYDFQFLVMYAVLMLFLERKEPKELKVSMLSVIAAGCALIAGCAGVFSVGRSDFLYMRNSPEQALKAYGGNTLAKIAMLLRAETTEEMDIQADSILESNQHVPVAYTAKARAAYAEGDMEAFIEYKLKAIQLGPYQRAEYEDYLYTLALGRQLFLEADDVASAEYCVERAKEIPEMLEAVKKRTSSLGWKIKDKPDVTLSESEKEILEEMGGM